ncbi:MAG: hypothetical protein ACPID7_04485, partial [Candidatus Puniceispirillum sp.]
DGKLYVGNYQDGKKHGYGEFYWPEGQSYKGDWQNGYYHYSLCKCCW